jgi:hypothetical protein
MKRCPECQEKLRPGDFSGQSAREPAFSPASPERGGQPRKSMSPLIIGLIACGGVFVLAIMFLFIQARSQALQAARRSQSKNNLKQIGIGLHIYNEIYDQFPPGGIYNSERQEFHGWQTMMLPFMDDGPLYERIDLNIPWDDPKNSPHFQYEIETYLRAGDEPRKNSESLALSHWAANERVMYSNSSVGVRDIADGLTNSLLVGEVARDFKPWGHPANWRDPAEGINQGPHTFGNPKSTDALFLLGDGSVRAISQDIDPQVLKALSTPDGGETIGAF